jgi:NitT/TauT family transport system substrate-binding protein
MKRRDFLLDLLATAPLATASLAVPKLSATETAEDTLKIGYLPILDATSLLIAHTQGFFTAEGLKVAEPMMATSWADLIIGFLSGKFNLVHFLNPIPIWLRYNHQIPIKIIAWAHINGSAILGCKTDHINSLHDLGGKRVAIPYWHSTHNVLLQIILRHVGLKPVIKKNFEKIEDNEVNLQVLPLALMVTALKAHNIEAFIVAEPFNAQGELLADGNILRFTGDVWKNHPCCVLCMPENTINTNPVFTQKVLNATVKAQIYAQQHKAEVAQILSKQGKSYIPVNVEVLNRALLGYDPTLYTDPKAILHADEWCNGRIDFAPWPYPSATRFLVEAMRKTVSPIKGQYLETLDAEFVVNDLVDYRFVKTAMERHKGWETAPGVDIEHPFTREEIIAV